MSMRASQWCASTADAHRLRVDRGKAHALVRERLDSLDPLDSLDSLESLESLECGVTCAEGLEFS